MKKVIVVLLSVLMCMIMMPAAYAEERGSVPAYAGGLALQDGEEGGAVSEAAAVSPAFQVKSFTSLNKDGLLLLPESMAGVEIKENEGGGIILNGKKEALMAGRITIDEEFDFDVKPEGRKTDVRPVGRIMLDALSDKSSKITAGIYLDDETEPRVSMLLKKQMGKKGWTKAGDQTFDVLSQNITGKHRVSIGFTVESTGKSTDILLRSISFCENSIPVMYFNLDESEGSIEAMNASPDHSEECYGNVTLQVPEGYASEFSKKPLETQENLELEYVRGRGNSTWDIDKKPYKVKFAKKQNLLGMGKNEHWVLLANRYDNTLLRNRVTYWIVRYLGIEFAIKCSPVEVVMNGRYYGSYLLSEQVRVDNNRVEIPKLNDEIKDPEDKDHLEITGGYLLNLNGFDEDSQDSAFATTREAYFGLESPDFSKYESTEEAKKAKTAQLKYIADFTQAAEDAIFGNDFKDKGGRSYSDLLDEDAAVDYWWIQEFSMNGDAYNGGSNYLYKKRNTLDEEGNIQIGRLYWGPLWDFDYVAWGNPNDNPDSYEGFNKTNHLWMNKLRTGSEFCERLKERWSEPEGAADNRYTAHLSDAVTEAVKEGGTIDRYYDEVRVSEYYDNMKYGFFNQGGGYNSYKGANAEPGKHDVLLPGQDPDGEQEENQGEQKKQTYESEIEQFRNWIKLRQSWVQENISDVGLKTYTVRFLIDGKVIESRSYGEEEELGELPKAPAKSGYTFLGWFDEYDIEATEESIAYEDVDLKAKYVKTSTLKKAKNIYFPIYDVYTWFFNYEETDNDYFPTYKLMPEDCAPEKITWSVNDPEVASVDSAGTVKPKKAGTVIVTAKLASGKSNSYTLTFIDENEEMLEVDEIILNKSKLSMKSGTYTQLRADLEPKPNSPSSLEWFSTDADVAAVDDFGIVQAKKKGKTAIVAMDPDSRRYAVCNVTVTASTKDMIKAAKAKKVKSVKAKAAKAGKKRSVKVSWKKASGVSGYYVLRASKKNGKYTKAGKVKKASKVKWTDKKVKKGKKYFYKVQPYTKIGKKVYKGRVSKAAKCKVK